MKELTHVFNEKWKQDFIKHRLEWVSTYSHTFVEFMEHFHLIKWLPNEDEERYGVFLRMETNLGVLELESVHPASNRIEYAYVIENGKAKSIQNHIPLTLLEKKMFCRTLDLLNIVEWHRDSQEIAEKEQWDEFVATHQDLIKGTFHQDGDCAIVIVNDVELDITPLYMAYKNKKWREL